MECYLSVSKTRTYQKDPEFLCVFFIPQRGRITQKSSLWIYSEIKQCLFQICIVYWCVLKSICVENIDVPCGTKRTDSRKCHTKSTLHNVYIPKREGSERKSRCSQATPVHAPCPVLTISFRVCLIISHLPTWTRFHSEALDRRFQALEETIVKSTHILFRRARLPEQCQVTFLPGTPWHLVRCRAQLSSVCPGNN